MNTSASLIFKLMDIFRAHGRLNDGLLGLYYILYCIYKGYRVYFTYDKQHCVTDVMIVSEDNRHFEDKIISKFPVVSIRNSFIGLPEKSIQSFFDILSKLNLHNDYIEIIDNLTDIFAQAAGGGLGDYAIPNHVASLVERIISFLPTKNIYNPYSELGSITSSLKSKSIVGEEPFVQAALIAKIRQDAHGIDSETIILGNPLVHSFPSEFDSFVSVPPFMMNLRDNEADLTGIDHKVSSVEDILLWRFLNESSYRTGVIIVPAGIGFAMKYRELRAAIIDGGCLDAVISLPAGIFFKTGINTLLLVLNKDKTNPLIRFIDGTKSFTKAENRTVLDYKNIVMKYVGDDNQTTYSATINEVVERDYSFMPSLYDFGDEQIVPEGYKKYKFSEVFRVARMAMCTPDDKGYILKSADFSRNLLDICDFKKEVESGMTSLYRKAMEPVTLALSFFGKEMKIVKLDGKSTVFADSNQIPLSFVPSSPVDFNYAIVALLKNENFNKLADNYKGWQLRRVRDLAKYLDTIMLIAPSSKDEQCRLFSEELNALKSEKAQFLKDELARLGTRETVSDLSHMMNTPFSNIGDLLGVLLDEEMSYAAKGWIVKLRDNFEYLKRLIKTVGADFSIDACSIEDIEIRGFMIEYMQSWSNINHQFFKTELLSNLSINKLCVKGNDTLLRIALDCIFKNAQRHGFKNKYSDSNKVSVTLSEVNHNNKPFVCISVANNGEPFPESFTIRDFIKRGKVAGDSGKTGLGGYHVYSIIKRLGGFLNLTKDGNGDVIFELLIPAPGLSFKTLNAYNNAESCL